MAGERRVCGWLPCKRLLDVVVGGGLFLLAAPLIAALAVGVAVSLRTWPFFVHERVGLGGRRFKLVKLRTLPRHSPVYGDKREIAAIPRPRFVSFLRRTHLDELPQLALVPLGKMSLVGPRPEMPRLHSALPAPFASARVAMRPGCTGLWQVGSDSHRLIAEAPDWDLVYLRSCTLRLDLWILWRTILLLSSVAPPIDLDMVPGRRRQFAPHAVFDGPDMHAGGMTLASQTQAS